MSDWLQWGSFQWWTFALIALSWIVLIFLEVQKPRREFLWLRLTGMTLIILGVAGVLWQPMIPGGVVDDNIVLVGEKTSDSQLDSLRQVLPKSTFVSHDTLFSAIQGCDILVTGQGIPVHDLWKIRENNITLLPSISPDAITAFYPETTGSRGDTLNVRGTYSRDSTWVRLRWNGQILDSVMTNEGGSFVLRDIPQVAGPRLYSIELQRQDSVQIYPWAIEIAENSPKRVGIYLSFPSFEVRALKEYLGKEGLSVLIRQSISRDKFSYEYLNTAERESMSWTDDFLGSLDILLLDQGFMDGLSGNQLSRLEKAVREGLGVILLPDGSSVGRGRLTLPVGESEGQLFLQPSSLIEAVYRENNQIVAGGRYIGLGKFMVSLNLQTYRWPLEGNSLRYESYWAGLVRATVRKSGRDRVSVEWPPRVNSPVQIEGSNRGVPEIQWANHVMAPRQDIYLQSIWGSTVWPDKPGWQEVIFSGDTSAVYVYDQDAWAGIRYTDQLRALRQLEGTESPISVETAEYKPVSRWVYFFLFLLGFALIWTEPKLSA